MKLFEKISLNRWCFTAIPLAISQQPSTMASAYTVVGKDAPKDAKDVESGSGLQSWAVGSGKISSRPKMDRPKPIDDGLGIGNHPLLWPYVMSVNDHNLSRWMMIFLTPMSDFLVVKHGESNP